MAEAGLLVAAPVPAGAPFGVPDPAFLQIPDLSPAQAAVAKRPSPGGGGAKAFSVTLLDGVTGSGKTEVYLEAVAEAVAAGRQALILLPEIALSAQFLARFERRFGVAAGRVAFRPGFPHPPHDLARRGRWPRRRWWWAPAPPCSCRFRTWAW